MIANQNIVNEKGWFSENSALKSPWFLGMIAMIIVVLSVNIAFVTIALKTAPDLTVEDYYERGKNFNEMLQRRAQEKALGWQAEVIIPVKPQVNIPAKFQFNIIDASGKAINADKVTFYAYRPSDADADFSINMKRIDDGLYGVDLSFALPGSWDLIVSVERDGDKLESPARLFVEK